MICLLSMVSCVATSPFRIRPDEAPVELEVVPMEEMVSIMEQEPVVEEPVEIIIEDPITEPIEEEIFIEEVMEPEPVVEPEPIPEPILESVPEPVIEQEPASNVWVGDVPDVIIYLIAFCFLSTLFALCYVAKQRKEAKWHMFHS